MIDIELTKSILNKYNKNEIGNDEKVILKELPVIDNSVVIDFENLETLSFKEKTVLEFFNKYKLPTSLLKKCNDKKFNLNKDLLQEIGINLYPFFSYGVLNGGSATSYIDKKKNKGFNASLFNQYSTIFNNLIDKYKNRAKGITPAFVNPNGLPGPSFLELKMRSLLLEAKKYNKLTNKPTDELFPIFQMTSTHNNNSISEFYENCKNSKYLKDLIIDTKIDITNVLTGIQPLIAAFSHSNTGKNKTIFYDKNGKMLPLPGGHGQCFFILKEIFKNLYSKGIRFISIGNVDNIGYTLDPVSLAILAISNKQATFDFSFKTSFDVKGGVLIKDQYGKLNCADLGVAVSKEDVTEAEKRSIPILFNCATGIFNLEFLINNIDYISNKLPTRFTDQNKDAGEYSQAEQVTWEVMSLLDDILILAVDKYDRFLASKLLIENLVTSGLPVDISDESLKLCAKALNDGLKKKLEKTFNLKLVNGEWINND